MKSDDPSYELTDGDPMDIDTDEISVPLGRAEAPRSPAGIAIITHSEPVSLFTMVRQDALNRFIPDCESILGTWMSLLRNTTLPHQISSSDDRVLEAFRALESVITDKLANPFIARLAWLQLTHMLDAVENIVKSERARKIIHRAPGYGNASVVLDVYMSASKGISRRTLIERRRTARRWERLAGPSPLLVLIYSNVAEAFV